MSGHSHFATIKRQKEANDAAKGKVFSKHAKSISIAIKSGGSADPELNSKLRFAIEQAKQDNVPRANIDRILARANEIGNLEEVSYEGYGPEGIAVIVEVVTDNRNRTGQEVKNLFERGGGSLAGPGSVSFNFTPKGLLVVEKSDNSSAQTLDLIDLGVEDVDEVDGELEVYVQPAELAKIKVQIEEKGFKVKSFSLIKKPKSMVRIDDESKAKRILTFIGNLEDLDDVQEVYSNFDIPDELIEKSLQ